MPPLFSLVYHSRITFARAEAEMADEIAGILAVSRRNNSRDDVTGALWLADGFFVQVLEGPQLAVQAAFARILKDPRHVEVTLLQMTTLDRRVFQDWSMGFVSDAPGLRQAAPGETGTVSSAALLDFFVGLLLRQAGRAWPPPARAA